MDPLLAAFVSAGFIVALEASTYWLVGFPVALAIFIAVVATVVSGTIFRVTQGRRKTAILLSLIPTTALPVAALLTWGLLVFQGVRAVESDMQFAPSLQDAFQWEIRHLTADISEAPIISLIVFV